MANDPFDTSDIVNAKIQVRRGVNDDRVTKTFEEGELIYSTDSRRLYIGGTTNGVTKIIGGSVVGNVLHYTTNIATVHYIERYDLLFNPKTTTLYTLTGSGQTLSDFAVIFDSSLYVTKANAEMKSDLNMNNFRIYNLGDAVEDKDAINKKTLDTSVKSLSSYLDKKLAEITSSTSSSLTKYVEKDGDTMSGMLEISAASPKSLYVRSGDTELQDTIVKSLTVVGDVTIKAPPKSTSTSTFDVNANTTFNDKVIKNFTANIIIIKDTSLIKLNFKDHNGQVLFLDSTASGTEKISVELYESQLIAGFNCVIIQGGTKQIKIVPKSKMHAVNSDNKYTTRKQYSQINLCMIDSDSMWVSGDLVQ